MNRSSRHRPAKHDILIRRHRGRIRVVHHHRLDGRPVQFRESLPEQAHIHDARLASQRRAMLQFRHLQTRAVELERLRCGKLQSASGFAPRSYQRRKSRDGSHGRAALFAALHSVAQPDRRRTRSRIIASQLNDVRSRDARERRHTLGRITRLTRSRSASKPLVYRST